MSELNVMYLWIPRDLGGHRGVPYLGMRPQIRWQAHIREHLERSRDVECVALTFDASTMRGVATLRLVSADPPPGEWLVDGTLVELLDGYRVIAVGRVSRDSAAPSIEE